MLVRELVLVLVPELALLQALAWVLNSRAQLPPISRMMSTSLATYQNGQSTRLGKPSPATTITNSVT